MTISRQLLVDQLSAITNRCIVSVSSFRSLDLEQLNFKEQPAKWSVLECIEHLNLYGDFYLPEIEKQLLRSKQDSKADTVRSGWIGNYFANLMKVNDGKMTKMKSPKDKNPSNSDLSITSIERFLKQQERMKALLHQSLRYDHSKVKCAISLTPMIKLRLGDTFRVVIYHNERHVIQAEKALEAYRTVQSADHVRGY